MSIIAPAAEPSAASATTLETLNFTRCPAVPTASALAYQLGYLQQEFGNEPGYTTVLKSIGFTGKTEYAHEERLWIRNAGHAPAVWAHALGVDSKVVALAWLEGSYPVITLAGSGIAGPADLRGRRVGVIGRVGQSFDLMIAQQLKIYTTALGTAGLGLGDVQRVDIPAPPYDSAPQANGLKADHFLEQARVLAAALVRGEVDAVITRLPQPVAEFLGVRTLYDTHDHPDPRARVHPSVLRGLVVSGALLAERRDIVVRYLVRLLQAAEWALAHPQRAVELIAADFKVAPEALSAAYDDVAAGIQIDLDADKVASLEAQKDFLLAHGFIARDFELAPWVDAGPLAEARRLYAERKARGER